jgi:S1-C subfamily serine protease
MPGVGMIPTIASLVSGCLAIAILEPTSTLGRQMPPTLVEKTNYPTLADVSAPKNSNDYLGAAGGPVDLPRLGIVVRNGSAKLDHGEQIVGALVTGVSPAGPAAGILTSHPASRLILEGALFGTAVASAVFFPPAAVGVATIACYVTDSYDLVIAVDGHRVRNTLDLVELIENTQSGDTVYLVIVRKGLRRKLAIRFQ